MSLHNIYPAAVSSCLTIIILLIYAVTVCSSKLSIPELIEKVMTPPSSGESLPKWEQFKELFESGSMVVL